MSLNDVSLSSNGAVPQSSRSHPSSGVERNDLGGPSRVSRPSRPLQAENSLRCNKCMAQLKTIVYNTKCDCLICEECFKPWLSHKERCPCCSRALTSEQDVHEFLITSYQHHNDPKMTENEIKRKQYQWMFVKESKKTGSLKYQDMHQRLVMQHRKQSENIRFVLMQMLRSNNTITQRAAQYSRGLQVAKEQETLMKQEMHKLKSLLENARTTIEGLNRRLEEKESQLIKFRKLHSPRAVQPLRNSVNSHHPPSHIDRSMRNDYIQKERNGMPPAPVEKLQTTEDPFFFSNSIGYSHREASREAHEKPSSHQPPPMHPRNLNMNGYSRSPSHNLFPQSRNQNMSPFAHGQPPFDSQNQNMNGNPRSSSFHRSPIIHQHPRTGEYPHGSSSMPFSEPYREPSQHAGFSVPRNILEHPLNTPTQAIADRTRGGTPISESYDKQRRYENHPYPYGSGASATGSRFSNSSSGRVINVSKDSPYPDFINRQRVRRKMDNGHTGYGYGR